MPKLGWSRCPRRPALLPTNRAARPLQAPSHSHNGTGPPPELALLLLVGEALHHADGHVEQEHEDLQGGREETGARSGGVGLQRLGGGRCTARRGGVAEGGMSLGGPAVIRVQRRAHARIMPLHVSRRGQTTMGGADEIRPCTCRLPTPQLAMSENTVDRLNTGNTPMPKPGNMGMPQPPKPQPPNCRGRVGAGRGPLHGCVPPAAALQAACAHAP